jgi:hypothetical protein
MTNAGENCDNRPANPARFGFDDDQDLPLILPESRENLPEGSIPPTQLQLVNFPVEDGQLLAQREIFCCERCSGHD